MVKIRTVERKVVWLSLEQVAQLLNISTRGVWALTRKGILPKLKLSHKRVYYRQDVVDELNRKGWPYRQWGKVLSPQAARFRKDEQRMHYMRKVRAQQRTNGA